MLYQMRLTNGASRPDFERDIHPGGRACRFRSTAADFQMTRKDFLEKCNDEGELIRLAGRFASRTQHLEFRNSSRSWRTRNLL